MNIYTVYIQNNNLEGAVLIPEGFSPAAAIFTIFWAIAKGLWLVLIGLTCIYSLISTAYSYHYLSDSEFVLMHIFTHVVMGIYAYDWQRSASLRQGYKFYDLISASTMLEAHYRFYTKL